MSTNDKQSVAIDNISNPVEPIDAGTRLNIAIIAHCLYPIAQPYAGGLEMITQLLCDELVAQGHNVTLYAHEDSETRANLRPFMSRAAFEATIHPNEHINVGMTRDALYEYRLYQEAMREIIENYNDGLLDAVHNHSLHYVPMLVGQALAKQFFTTFHTPVFPNLELGLSILSKGTQTQFTSVSQFQQSLYNQFVHSTVVYNGIDVNNFTPNTQVVAQEQYFWFGRICPEKGTHLAMKYCLAAGKTLIIAGPKSNQGYYDAEVAPLFEQDKQQNGDNLLLKYVGHLTKDEVNTQLQQATAMLFTSTWEEPYGLTLAESLACGCPVIGFAVGAAPEIITEQTGVIVPKLDESAFLQAFDKVQGLSRQACRTRAEQFCSVDAMVTGYLACYRRGLEDSKTTVKAAPKTSSKEDDIEKTIIEKTVIEQAVIEQTREVTELSDISPNSVSNLLLKAI